MKKFIYLATLVLFSFFFTTSVSAETIQKKEIGNVEVELFEDGRVSPIKNPEELNEEELNTILYEIGHSFVDIKNYDTRYKRKLVSYGGKRVSPDNIQLEYSYKSKDDEYSVKEYTLDQIKNKQIEDLKKSNITDPEVIEKLVLSSDSISTFGLQDCQTDNGECEYGKFTGRLQAYKIGESKHQSEYIFQQNWDWIQEPFIQGTDFAGIHWGAKGEPEAGTAYGEGAYSWDDEFYNYFEIPIDTSSTYGITADVEFPVDDLGRYEHYQGAISEIVHINTNTHPPGTRATISGVYAHPHTPNNWSIGVSAGGLSISGNIGSGDKFTWRYSFTVK